MVKKRFLLINLCVEKGIGRWLEIIIKRYSNNFVFGWISRLIEYPLAKILGRPRGHRESLHTIVKIIITSLFFSIISSLILQYFLNEPFKLFAIPFLFLFLFLDQLMHVLCDWHLVFK